MSLRDVAKKIGRKLDQPLYTKNSNIDGAVDLTDLIKLEWLVINKLLELADEADYEKNQARFYVALASHARVLAGLLKISRVKTEEAESLATLFEKMAKNARIMSREIRKHGRRIKDATL